MRPFIQRGLWINAFTFTLSTVDTWKCFLMDHTKPLEGPYFLADENDDDYLDIENIDIQVKITEKCDVYGFEVLVLKIMTGWRPMKYMKDGIVILCDMVRGALEEGRMDERLQGKFRQRKKFL
ncbi:hypothetical protein L1887_42406 [Cichorium endivia]|nr:hypothetical protein L1887_42406 [Cichorium endivia]